MKKTKINDWALKETILQINTYGNNPEYYKDWEGTSLFETLWTSNNYAP